MSFQDIKLISLDPHSGIKGVAKVTQNRSLVARDALIEAGINMLNEKRFSEIRIADIAASCGQSVGGFYARFEDKDAYFRAMRAAVFSTIEQTIPDQISGEILAPLSLEDGLALMVDTLVDLFTANWRGLLRESLIRILDPEEPWEPARNVARMIVENAQEGLADKVSARTYDEASEKIAFCFQAVVGVLQNDLVNANHVYSTKEGTIGAGLKAMIIAYARSSPVDA